MIWTETAVLI